MEKLEQMLWHIRDLNNFAEVAKLGPNSTFVIIGSIFMSIWI